MLRLLPIAAIATAFAMPAAAQDMAPAAYVAAAGASDLYEKTSSQLVLQSTNDAKVRAFAQGRYVDRIDAEAVK